MELETLVLAGQAFGEVPRGLPTGLGPPGPPGSEHTYRVLQHLGLGLKGCGRLQLVLQQPRPKSPGCCGLP